MANYTDDQISAAVSQFIKSSVTVKKDALGPIDVSAKFEETLQLFSSTLILDPNSIFYLICLASNKLNAEVLQAIDLVTDIDIAITEMAKRTTNVTQTTQLGNAASALLTANSILNKDAAVSAAPLDKYNQALKNFTTASLAPNVKQGSAIVRPPQAAQAAARTDLASLAPMYIDILSWAARLMTILPLAGGGQFKSLNLQVIALQESLIQARSNLISLQKAFEDPTTTQDQKIALCKDAFLQITAGQAVIKNLSVVADPLLPRMSSNDGLLLGYPAMPGPSGTFTPATVLGTRSAPWVITPGTQDQMVIAEDGNAPTTYTITVPPQPFVESIGIAPSYDLHGWSTACVVGTGPAPFTIPDVPGGLFEVYVDGILYSGHINVGTYDMPAMLGALQDLRNTHGDTLSSVISVDDGGNAYVHFTYPTAGFHTIMVGEFDPVTNPYTSRLGFMNNPSSTGVDANNLIEIDGNPSTVLSSGSASDIATAINSWASVASLPYHATADGTKISIANTAPGAQKITLTATSVDRATVLRAYTTLGFFEGQSDENGDVTAQKVADYINSIGKLKAAVVRQDFAHDTTGSAIGPQTFQVPVDAVPQSSPTDHAGDMLYILNGANADYYRIVSITTSGSFDLITIENTSTLSYPDTGHVGWSVVRETVSLTSTLTKDSLNGLTTKVDVKAASANSVLGYTVGVAVGTTSGFKVKKSGVDQDFSASDVEVGDYVLLAGPAVSAVVGTLYLDGSMIGCPGWLALNAITSSDFASCSVSSSTSPLLLWQGAHYSDLGERLNVWPAGTLRVRANVLVSLPAEVYEGSAQLQVSLYRCSQEGESITLVSEVLSSVFSNTSWEVVTVEAPYAESTGNTDDFVYMEIKAITSSGSPITVEIATGQSDENSGIYSTMSMNLLFRQ